MTPQHPVSNERAAVQCYRCLMFGHYASSCPNVPAGTIAPRSHQNGRRNRNIVCHYCGIPGHVQRECRKRLRAQGFVSSRAQSGQNCRSQSQVPYNHQNPPIPRFSELGIGNLDNISSDGRHSLNQNRPTMDPSRQERIREGQQGYFNSSNNNFMQATNQDSRQWNQGVTNTSYDSYGCDTSAPPLGPGNPNATSHSASFPVSSSMVPEILIFPP